MKDWVKYTKGIELYFESRSFNTAEETRGDLTSGVILWSMFGTHQPISLLGATASYGSDALNTSMVDMTSVVIWVGDREGLGSSDVGENVIIWRIHHFLNIR